MIANGNYARTSTGTVYVYGFESGLLQTVSVEHDQEQQHLKHELTAWVPLTGERVMESGPDNEGAIIGVVITGGVRTALVRWPGYAEPEVWRNMQLEPAWD